MCAETQDPCRPRFSFVIPVWHEEKRTPALIRAIRALDGGDECEVIVVDGDPAGSTLSEIDDARALRLTAPKGRAHQMNAGAARARGEVLVFLHADTTPPPTMLSDMRDVLGSGASGGAFRLRFDSPRRVYRFMSWWVNATARISRLPWGDQAIFVTRDAFRRIGGYAPIPVMEDVDLVRRMRRSGERLTIAPTAVRTSSRRMETEGILRCVARNWWITVLFDVGVSPRVLARWYTDDHRLPAPAPQAGEEAGVELARPGDTP